MSRHPPLTHHFRLRQDQLRRVLLLVRRVAVVTQKMLDQTCILARPLQRALLMSSTRRLETPPATSTMAMRVMVSMRLTLRSFGSVGAIAGRRATYVTAAP